MLFLVRPAVRRPGNSGEARRFDGAPAIDTDAVAAVIQTFERLPDVRQRPSRDGRFFESSRFIFRRGHLINGILDFGRACRARFTFESGNLGQQFTFTFEQTLLHLFCIHDSAPKINRYLI